ncbi:hypothetical protein FACS1894105_14380 [Clostridia bacterium]|nr:hypothetical protein FACS1894105_14380 [Clostridia bacterium]
MTNFTLIIARNAGGVEYSQAQFECVRHLTDAEYAYTLTTAAQIKKYDEKLGFASDDSDCVIDESTGELLKPLNGARDV